MCGLIVVDAGSTFHGVFADACLLFGICLHAASRSNHKAVSVECFFRFLNKAVTIITSSDCDTPLVPVKAAMIATYTWNCSPIDDGYIITGNGKSKRLRKTTKGWMLCVHWKDQLTSWEQLADLKESNPVVVAEYAVSRDIHKEPAFAWWVPYTMKKRNRILAAVQARYHKKTHKFGIRMPKSVQEAYTIDKSNGNEDWRKSIQKEMNDVMIAFQVLEDTEDVPIGHEYVKCRVIFDLKMENFRRKARLVAGGHMTSPPAAATYASVVSHKSV
jgi:hypothetical protein